MSVNLAFSPNHFFYYGSPDMPTVDQCTTILSAPPVCNSQFADNSNACYQYQLCQNKKASTFLLQTGGTETNTEETRNADYTQLYQAEIGKSIGYSLGIAFTGILIFRSYFIQ